MRGLASYSRRKYRVTTKLEEAALQWIMIRVREYVRRFELREQGLARDKKQEWEIAPRESAIRMLIDGGYTEYDAADLFATLVQEERRRTR